MALLVAAGAAGVVGYGAWYHLVRNVAVTYADPVERFKYGSTGSETKNGLPKLVFIVLPELCPEKLPGGWPSIGMQFEPGHETPIGLSERTIGFPRLGVNCAFCHTGTVRTSPDARPTLVWGMPPQTFDLQKYLSFLVDCVGDARFTPDNVLAAIEKRHPLSAVEKLVYRLAVVPTLRKVVTTELKGQIAWYHNRPVAGPGRYDAINAVRVMVDLAPEKDDLVSTVDFPSLWNQKYRVHHFGNWGGDHVSLKERNRAAASLAASTAQVIDDAALSQQEGWLLDLAPPKYPFPVDAALAQKGLPVFEAHCARCHGPESKTVGRIVPLDEVRTDGARLAGFTKEIPQRLNQITTPTFKIRSVQLTNGYLSPLLDGVWARAPYLHNGSVPNLRELLEPPEKRSKVFHRGYDVYDPENVGFVSRGSEAEKHGFKFDTSVRGNGNGGHLYGTELSAEDKNALVEFLKSYELPPLKTPVI